MKQSVGAAVSGVLAASLATSLGVPATAVAQPTSSQAGATQLSPLQVTGTRIIQTGGLNTTAPVEVISRQQIDATGLTSLGQVLQNITIAGSAQNTLFNFGANGETNIDLRNLGAKRLLVLVNGRRWVTGSDGNVDLNTIPLSIIDHLEILKSSGAALYGSDAIAGVINIITNKNFSGIAARAYYGEYVEGGHYDGETQHYSFTAGANNGRGSVIFNASYRIQDPVVGGDRAISSVPDIGTGTTRGSSTTVQGRFKVRNPNTGQTSDLTLKDGRPGNSLSDFRPFDTLTDRYNYAPTNYLLTPSKRLGLYTQVHYDLNDAVTFYSEALYNRRNSTQQEGPAELSIGAQGSHPIGVAATNPYNPFGYALTATGSDPSLLLLNRQPVEAGARHVQETVDTVHFAGGLKGSFDVFNRNFNWNVGYVYNRNHMSTSNGPIFNLNRVATALGPSAQCGAGSSNPGCVPLNLFGGQYQGGTITPAMLDYITITQQRNEETTLRDYTVNLSGDVITLPAGALDFAVGYEHRVQSGSNKPDALTAAGLSSERADTPISGSYNVDAEYLEFNVPLLANLPAVHELSLDVAGRHVDFSSFGSANIGQAGLKWKATNNLLLHATWSQGFRAPDVQELFSGRNQTGVPLSDPCSGYQGPGTSSQVSTACQAVGVPANYTQPDPQIRTTTGANPHLEPETSIARTIGFNYSPAVLPDLSIDADYFQIEVDNTVTTLSAQRILNGCYRGGNGSLCNLINRNQTGAITRLLNINTNIGGTETEGADADITYRFPSTSVGDFNARWRTTYTRDFTEKVPNLTDPQGAPTVVKRIATETGSPVQAFPRFKSNLRLNWNYQDWTAALTARFLGAITESCSDSFDGTSLSLTNLGLCSDPNFDHNSKSRNHIGATTYFDFQASYDWSALNTRVTIGVRNLLDRQPPIAHSVSSNFDRTLYEIPGRFPYVRVTTHF